MTYVLNTWLYPDNVSSACTYNPIALFIRVLWVPKVNNKICLRHEYIPSC